MTAAGVCLRQVEGELQVLMVRSSAGRWIFPKGKAKTGENGPQAAWRETVEESGWAGTYEHGKESLGSFEDAHGPVFAFLLEKAVQTHPGEPRRFPTWFFLDDARALIEDDHPVETAEQMIAVLEEAERRFGG